jgi:hypothetical protein
LYFEAPAFESSTAEPRDAVERSFDDRYFEPVRHSAEEAASSGSSNTGTSAHRARPLVETPLFEWPPTLELNMGSSPPASQPGSSTEFARPAHSPSFSSWRPAVRPTNSTAVMDTTSADLRRFIGTYTPPPQPRSPMRLYPRPASLAAPLSVPATTSGLEAAALDADLVDAYLEFHRSDLSARAWENALDRARTLHQERERDRELERERSRAAELERERERERGREDEAERERDHPWSLDSIWEANARAESSSSSARARPWESLTLRARRDLSEDNGRELDAELVRRRAIQRQYHQAIDRDRERQRDEQHAQGQSSVSRAARYLASGLVDPREAPRPIPDASGLDDFKLLNFFILY